MVEAALSRRGQAIILAACVGCFTTAALAQNAQPVNLPPEAAVSAIEEDSFPIDEINRSYRDSRPRLIAFRVAVDTASRVLNINAVDQKVGDWITALAKKLKFAQIKLNGERLPWTSVIALCFLDQPPAVLPCVPANNTTGAPSRIRILGKAAKDLYLRPRPKGYQVNTAGIDFPPPSTPMDAQGVFRVRIIVNPSGQVSNLKVVSSHPDMESAISESVKKWTYVPLLWNGTPVEVEASFEISYTYSEMPFRRRTP